MTSTLDIRARLQEVWVKASDALRTTADDGGASVVTVAVVREFAAKADKALAADAARARDAVIELEQAADSARAAAAADTTLAAASRDAVDDAHLAICVLKTAV